MQLYQHDQPETPQAFGFREKHYTVTELANFWRMSGDTVRRLFRREPGVIRIRDANSRRRIYVSLRIPESVAERVWHRLRSVA